MAVLAATLPSVELVIAGDGVAANHVLTSWTKTVPELQAAKPRVLGVVAEGFIESVLDLVVRSCVGRWVLRLDDDERCSPAMVRWLVEERYKAEQHWKFARAHLWGNPKTVIRNMQLYPDHQTRLSLLEMSGGRNHIHAGSPYGGGVLAPCVIEHHKFLIRSLDERLVIADRYDRIQQGAGRLGGMAMFQIPESCDLSTTRYVPLGDGLDAEIGGSV
jgi:hypothetical protein